MFDVDLVFDMGYFLYVDVEYFVDLWNVVYFVMWEIVIWYINGKKIVIEGWFWEVDLKYL